MNDPTRWLERWSTGETGWHRPEPNPLLVAHVPASWKRVLVPLCGASVDLGWLVDSGREVVGIELSRIAADRVFTERDQTPTETRVGEFTVLRAGALTIAVGDVFELDPSVVGEIDAIWDRAALIALPLALRARYVQTLRTTAPGADVLLTVMEYAPGALDGPPHSVSPHEVEALYPGAQLLLEEDISDNMNDRGREGTFAQRLYRTVI